MLITALNAYHLKCMDEVQSGVPIVILDDDLLA